MVREDEIKNEVRAIYAELKGYLSQTPKPKDSSDFFYSNENWKQYNGAIHELNKITEKNYNRFIITPEVVEGDQIVHITTYRHTLGGIINRLHSTHFSDEPQPFSGTPHTIISQSQSQNQMVQMLLEFDRKIESELLKAKGDPNKEGFLRKCRDSLNYVKNVKDLIKLLIETAKQFNLNITDLASLFI